MSEWQKVEEQGQEVWIHPQYGNIVKNADGKWVAMIASIIHLGPFPDLEKAQSTLENNYEEFTRKVDDVIVSFNESLIAPLTGGNENKDA